MIQKEPKIKIFVAHHKQWYIYEDDVIVPIQAGKKNAKIDLWISWDDTWDNISDRNGEYSELTMQYWVWKNYDLSDVDYVWFCHYRRYMTYYYTPNFININRNLLLIDKRFWMRGTINEINEGLIYKNFYKKILNNNSINLKKHIFETRQDVYLPKREIVITRKFLSFLWIKCNLYENFNAEDNIWAKNNKLNMASREIFQKKYLKYRDAYAKLKKNENEKLYTWNHRNMFIMKKDLFYEYMQWLFDYLFDVEEYILKNNIDIKQECDWRWRFLWMFSEKLINYFIAYERINGRDVSFNSSVLFFK